MKPQTHFLQKHSPSKAPFFRAFFIFLLTLFPSPDLRDFAFGEAIDIAAAPAQDGLCRGDPAEELEL